LKEKNSFLKRDSTLLAEESTLKKSFIWPNTIKQKRLCLKIIVVTRAPATLKLHQGQRGQM
jgi:hypothetical protein